MDTSNLDCSVSDEGGGLKSGSGSATSDESGPTAPNDMPVMRTRWMAGTAAPKSG